MNSINHAVLIRYSMMVSAILACGLVAPTLAQVDACAQTAAPSGGTVYTSDGTGGGNADGNYELWHDGSGSMKMTVYGKRAAFKAEWNNAGDFLARVGYKWNETQTYDKYGTVNADFKFTKSGSGGGYSYIGIYGWSNNPLVEYYVVENGFWTTVPNAGALGGAQSKGNFTVDGGTYDIYTYQRVNKPSIHGDATFMQFWSVRRTPRTCGRISLSEHWKKWASLNMTLGKMYEAKLLVEAGGGQGTFDLTYATMDVNVTTSVKAPEPQISRSGALWNNGQSGVVSLFSMDGKVLQTASQDAAKPALLSTSSLPRGVYVLKFQGVGSAPESRKLVLE